MLKLHFIKVLLIALAMALAACSQDTEPLVVKAVADITHDDPEIVMDAETGEPCDIHFELNFGDVCFPHKVHRKLGCGECHHQFPAVKLETPHPEYLTSSWHSCSSCHASEERPRRYQACVDCHLEHPDNIADETPSAKVALHKNCWKCHESGVGVDASQGCVDCHEDNGH